MENEQTKIAEISTHNIIPDQVPVTREHVDKIKAKLIKKNKKASKGKDVEGSEK